MFKIPICLFLFYFISICETVNEYSAVAVDTLYSGTLWKDIVLQSTVQTPAGDLISVGYQILSWNSPTDVKSNAIITLLDQNGNIKKSNSISDTFGGHMEDICVLSTGDLIAVGSTKPPDLAEGVGKGWILKLNSNGDTLWSKYYGTDSLQYFMNVVPSDNGKFVVAGSKESSRGDLDVWIMQMDNDGNILWEKTYGGNKGEFVGGLAALKEGGFLFCGSTSSFGIGGYDIYLLILDNNGDTTLSKVYGDTLDDYCYDVKELSNGNIVYCGRTQRVLNDSIYLCNELTLVNSSGAVIKNNVFPTEGSWYGRNIVTAPNDNIYVFNRSTKCDTITGYGSHLALYDLSGDTVWTKQYYYDDYQSFTNLTYLQSNRIFLTAYKYIGETIYPQFIIIENYNSNVLNPRKSLNRLNMCLNGNRKKNGFQLNGRLTNTRLSNKIASGAIIKNNSIEIRCGGKHSANRL